MQKYSKREKNRAKDLMHKITTTIARELKSTKSGVILEDLRNIKDRILNGSKNLNRKLSKWNCRTFQFTLEYKLKWFGLPVKYVNPANSSKTCSVCSGRLSAYRDRLLKCNKCGSIQDRDIVAVLNLRMWGLGVAPKGDKPLKGDASQGGCHASSIRRTPSNIIRRSPKFGLKSTSPFDTTRKTPKKAIKTPRSFLILIISFRKR